VQQRCGIRSLQLNACGDLLAAAGCGPKETAILSLPDCNVILRLRVGFRPLVEMPWLHERKLGCAGSSFTMRFVWCHEM
jgi:hypothetical protein